MALPKVRSQPLEGEAVSSPQRAVRLAGADAPAAPSPARALQEGLAATWREDDRLAPIPGRWSARRSFVFIAGSSALLWAGIIGGVAYLLNN
ncbi:MAG: hypothetical protein ACK41C_09130 [Phenylobacterium sp.]|uniref:hypothetical protein n=1 Tax=Phenylobacterium sp. TaxID=1871053 RepID=UPI003919ED90